MKSYLFCQALADIILGLTKGLFKAIFNCFKMKNKKSSNIVLPSEGNRLKIRVKEKRTYTRVIKEKIIELEY